MIAPSADGCKRLLGSRRLNPKSFLVAPEAQSSDRSGKRRVDFTLVEPSPDVVFNQELIVRHAIEAHVAFAKRRGPIGRPFQHLSTQALVAPCASDREVVHVHSIIFDDLRPDDWISQQESKGAD